MYPDKILSHQQTIIIQHMVDGLTVKEIAIAMGIGESTIHKYFERASRKLGAKTHDHAIALAVTRGEVEVKVII